METKFQGLKAPKLDNLEELKSGHFRDKLTNIVYHKDYIKRVREIEKEAEELAKKPEKTEAKKTEKK